MSRFTTKLVSLFFGLLGIVLLVAVAIRVSNQGIYADTHGTQGGFDLLDGALFLGGLLSLVLSLGFFDEVYSKITRK